MKKPNKSQYRQKVVPVMLTTGLLAGVGVTAGNAIQMNSLSDIKLGDEVAHAKTVKRGVAGRGEWTMQPETITRSSAPIFWGNNAGWYFTLHRTAGSDGEGVGDPVYCINLGLYGDAAVKDASIVDNDGNIIVGTGQGTKELNGLHLDDLKGSGTLALLEMAGDQGYKGLLRYRDKLFNGMPPTDSCNIGGVTVSGIPGANYVVLMQLAVHYSELASFYNHGGGQGGIGYAAVFKNNVDRMAASGSGAAGLSGAGYNFNSGQLAKMVQNLVAYARDHYKAPDLNSIATQKFTVNLQAQGKKMDKPDPNKPEDWGGFAETIGKDDPKEIDVDAETADLPDNKDGKYNKLEDPRGDFQSFPHLLGSAPIAIDGDNMDNKKVTLALTGINADKDYDLYYKKHDGSKGTIHLTSTRMGISDVVGYQISSKKVKTTSDGVLDPDSVDPKKRSQVMQWQPEVYKFGDPIDFQKLNGHYVRVIVKDGVTGFGKNDLDIPVPNKFSWRGANALHVQLNASLPKSEQKLPMAILFGVRIAQQDYGGTRAKSFTYNPISMQEKMVFHVRQTDTDDGHTGTGTSTTTPGIKSMTKVPKSMDTFTTKTMDDIPTPAKTDKTNKSVDTFSDGMHQVSPKWPKKVADNPEFNDSFKAMLAKTHIKKINNLTPGGEYAYTMHIKTGPSIYKHGSEEIKDLEAKDLQLPKWFVYKTAIASVGPDYKHQNVNNAITKKAKISYTPKADGSGTVKFSLPHIADSADLTEAIKPALKSDNGEVDVTIFGTIDPNAQAYADEHNEFLWNMQYDTRKVTGPGKTTNPPKVTRIPGDSIKGVALLDDQKDFNDFFKTVAHVNPKFGKTVGANPSSMPSDHVSMSSDNLKTARVRSLNSNMTGDETGAYGSQSNEVIKPSAYKDILKTKLKISNPADQKKIYYIVIANSGNEFGGKDKKSEGYDRLHFSDYLDPNLKLDTKNRPMMAFDLSQMETRKSGSNGSVLTPYAQTGVFGAKAGSAATSYMSNLILDTSNQLGASGLNKFGINDISKQAMSNGLGAYTSPSDLKAWADGVGKVGSKNYTSYFRTNKGGKYTDVKKLGAVEDTNGSYDSSRQLSGTNEKGWYAYAHGGTENGSTSATRDLDGRQRVSWTLTGADAHALTAHTLMFMIPVSVKDNATYVTNNNQTPDIQNASYFGGSNSETPGNPPDTNPGGNPPTMDHMDTSTHDAIDHGNGHGYSNTVVINPIRKDTLLTKKQIKLPERKHSGSTPTSDTFTTEKQHQNFDDTFSYKLSIRMPNWADKNNLDDMHGKDAKFAFYDKLALPYDVKNVTVYDQTTHRTLVPSLKSGLKSGKIALEKQPKWDSTKATQHPKVMYRPYGDVTSDHPQDVYTLANHKLTMRIKVNAPFEQGENNKRLGNISNSKTDAIYDQYMEKHNAGAHKYDVPNTFGVTRQSTVDDLHDGLHTSNTVMTEFGSRAEMSVNAMRVDTNKLARGTGDNFKMFFSTKMPFGTSNKDLTGDVKISVVADKMDNAHLDKNITLYQHKIPLKRLATVDNLRTFSHDSNAIKKYQQGSQGIGKYTLNGQLDFSELAANKSLAKYYTGYSLRDGENHEIAYLKPNAVDETGAVKTADNSDQQAFDSHRRPLYLRVKVRAAEQNPERDLSINGDRSFRGSNGRFINPFKDGMVARADVAYQNGIDPRFVSVAPESSYAYFGQNRKGTDVNGTNAKAHKGVSVIQTLYDATQLHRFDKQGTPTEKQGNVDQTIGAGAGDGIRNDVRLQRFGWGNLNSSPTKSSSNTNISTKKMLENDQMEFVFDSQLENGSGIKYKTADKGTIVKEANNRFLRSTGANVANNWGRENSFWTAKNGNVEFHKGWAKANGYRFVNKDADAYKRDMLHASVDSEAVTKGDGDAKNYIVPRAQEQSAPLANKATAYGAKLGKDLTDLQSSKVVVDGGHVEDTAWKKEDGHISDNVAKNLIIKNQSGITSIYNAPNSKQDASAAKNYGDKKSADELTTDAGNFFATRIGNNYKNYQFYNRVLKRGTGQVKLGDDQKDTDVLRSAFTNNARGKRIKGVVNGHDKFYLPLWFTNNNEHDTFTRGTGEAAINPLIYYSDGDVNRINADYSDVNFTRWLRVFGHRYGFDGSNSSDFDSILISGHVRGTKSKSLNNHENQVLNDAQNFDRNGKPEGMVD